MKSITILVISHLSATAFLFINKTFQCSSGEAAFQRAVKEGDEDAVQQLLADRQRLQDPNCRDENGTTSLHMAAQAGFNRIILHLLADPRVEVNCRGINGVTALFVAAEAGHDRVVQTMINDGRVEKNSAKDCGCTPLRAAALCGIM